MLWLVLFALLFVECESNAANAATCEAPIDCPAMKDGNMEGLGGFAIKVTTSGAAPTAVTEYMPGSTYLVTLERTGAAEADKAFLGFTLQANEAAGDAGRGKAYVGEFMGGSDLPEKTVLGCNVATKDTPEKGAVSHQANTFAGSSGAFKWKAPAAADAKEVNFNAIGVVSKAKWYGQKTDVTLKITVQQAATDACTTDTDTEAKCTAKDGCEWKNSACAKKATVVAVDCTAASLSTEAKCKEKTECEWKDSACSKKVAAVVVDCTADALKTEAKCKEKTECEFKDDKCQKKTAAPVACSDKKDEATCKAVATCAYSEKKCVTKASVECPKKTKEADCTADATCKWDTDKCKEKQVETKTSGAIYTSCVVALLSVAVAAKLW